MLRRRLRLVVITDAVLAAPRRVDDVVAAAVEGGAGVIQLRMKEVGSREMAAAAERLLKLTRRRGAYLIVNDRLDVALAAGADGVHLGPTDLPVGSVRAVVPDHFVIGYSTDQPADALAAEEAGADYIGCGAVFGTTTKDVGGERIGLEGLDAVSRAVTVPVIGVGGITTANVGSLAGTWAAGVAVAGAVMASPDPRTTTTALLDALGALPEHDG